MFVIFDNFNLTNTGFNLSFSVFHKLVALTAVRYKASSVMTKGC